jgi:PAP2 superfamily C-terminal
MSSPEIAPPGVAGDASGEASAGATHDVKPAVAPGAAQAAARSRRWKTLALRIAITATALVVWFCTQSLLGARVGDANTIGDGLHRLTVPVNSYLQNAPREANALLIASSLGIDALGLFLLGSWIFAGKLRPFLGLAMLLILRQIMQALCALPPPPGMIWHYPGFPSLLVTYGVTNDFFFSGHTAIAVFGATELARLHKTWLTGCAILLAIFEIASVVILRAHYTMDIFTGLLAALCVAAISDPISQWIRARTRPAET